jgi:hypothetical protein
MRTLRQLLVLPLCFVVGLSSSAFAQQRHVVDAGALAKVLSEHTAEQDAQRTAVREALGRQEVKDVAARMGIDLERLNTAVNTMAGDDLGKAAASAHQLNDTLAGGASTVVISTTTIIIVLLLILIIVAVAD